MGWATRIIVAQRVGTIMKADRILVMDEGRIVGSGTHAELLESNETYREIVYSQLSEDGGRGMSAQAGRARPARWRCQPGPRVRAPAARRWAPAAPGGGGPE